MINNPWTTHKTTEGWGLGVEDQEEVRWIKEKKRKPCQEKVGEDCRKTERRSRKSVEQWQVTREELIGKRQADEEDEKENVENIWVWKLSSVGINKMTTLGVVNCSSEKRATMTATL